MAGTTINGSKNPLFTSPTILFAILVITIYFINTLFLFCHCMKMQFLNNSYSLVFSSTVCNNQNWNKGRNTPSNENTHIYILNKFYERFLSFLLFDYKHSFSSYNFFFINSALYTFLTISSEECGFIQIYDIFFLLLFFINKYFLNSVLQKKKNCEMCWDYFSLI